MSRLVELVKRHEGLRLHVYLDTLGHPTIGYGRALDTNGISQEEAEMLLKNDLKRSEVEAETFHWFLELNDARRDAIISMLFNLGLPRFLGFRKMIQALEQKDYEEAARQMLDSKWSEQVGKRSHELSEMIRIGQYI